MMDITEGIPSVAHAKVILGFILVPTSAIDSFTQVPVPLADLREQLKVDAHDLADNLDVIANSCFLEYMLLGTVGRL